MTRLRAEKVGKVADDIPPLEVDHEDGADVLVLGWGSSYGHDPGGGPARAPEGQEGRVRASASTSTRCRTTLGDVLRSYRKVIVPEMNMGQLVKIIRAEFLVDADSVTKVEGLPFFADELEAAILERLTTRN